MLNTFIEVNLLEILNKLGKKQVEKIILNFKSPLNKDIEGFLHSKAIEFSKQGIARTHLIFSNYNGDIVLVAYYTLANKYIAIDRNSLSKTMKKRIGKYGRYNQDTKKIDIPMQLIAQLGKNYYNGYDKLISGDEVLKRACDKIKKVQNIIGGKYVYLECEDKPKLIEFYRNNGFFSFGSRALDKDETLEGEYLIQLLKRL